MTDSKANAKDAKAQPTPERGYPPTIYWWLSLIRASLNEMSDNIIEDDEDEGD